MVFRFSLYRMVRVHCWYVTCVDTYAETHVNSSAVTPGAAANAAEDGKQRKHAALTVRF